MSLSRVNLDSNQSVKSTRVKTVQCIFTSERSSQCLSVHLTYNINIYDYSVSDLAGMVSKVTLTVSSGIYCMRFTPGHWTMLQRGGGSWCGPQEVSFTVRSNSMTLLLLSFARCSRDLCISMSRFFDVCVSLFLFL